MSLLNWIKAFRLRTLPLSLSGIIVSYFYYTFHFSEKNIIVFVLALITTLLLQILSNLANDYGDGIKGTDNINRVGPERGLQSGAITQVQMKRAIVLFSVLAFISGLALLFIAFGKDKWLQLVLFILLGLGAIAAAIKYTIGTSAYGYRALGDLFVFVFFGLVGVLGFYLLLATSLNVEIILLSIIIGSFSTLVLNLNNMRDAENDKASNKITIPVLLGFGKAKIYHYTLLIIVLFSMIAFNYCINKSLIWLNLIVLLPLLIHFIKVQKIREFKDFDPELKKVALTTFGFAVLNSILLSLC